MTYQTCKQSIRYKLTLIIIIFRSYTSGSGICKAAVHAGVIGSEGGQVMVTVGFGQKSYIGSTAGSVTSEGHGADRRSVVIARPTSKVLGRVAIVPSLVNAGSSTFGSA